jgi:hypothetical protein
MKRCLQGFLIDDLKKLKYHTDKIIEDIYLRTQEDDFKEDIEFIENFLSYWRQHAQIKDTQEFIYLDDDYKNILYTSRNKPLKYEDQTPCIMVQVQDERDMDIILDLMNLK